MPIAYGELFAGNMMSVVLLLSLLLKGSLILGLGWALVRVLRRGSAAVRHGIWACAVLCTVVLPFATPLLPSLAVPLPELGQLSSDTTPQEGSVVAPLETRGFSATSTASLPVPPDEQILQLEHDAVADDPPIPHASSTIDWIRALLFIWITGVGLRVLWLLLQFARVGWLSGYARPEMDGPLVRAAERLARDLNIRRSVRVLESAWVSMPLTWGLFRPTILLPEEASTWPETRLRVVLLHELAHIRRWDYLTCLLAELACVIYWPTPLAWLARSRIQLEQEQACDDLVLRAGIPSVEYAEHLLAVARSFYGNRWHLGATVSMAREISLKRRVRTILDEQTNRKPLLSRSGLPMLLLVGTSAVLIGALRPAATAAEPAPSASSSTHSTGLKVDEPADPRPADELVSAPGSLWLEAEQGVARGPMEIREDLSASSGAYVVVPDGRGNDAPEGGAGSMSFTFEVRDPAEYVVWGRVLGPRDNDNSLYVSIDSGPEILWHVKDREGRPIREWSWLPLMDRDAGEEDSEPLRFDLRSGTHTLTVRNREDGTRLDRLLITTDITARPNGRGRLPVGYQPVYRWLEVEQASLEGAMGDGSDELTSGGQYVSFEQGTESRASGRATFAFEVESAGYYVVWGRVLAPDQESNSFYLSLDGGEEVIWDAPSRSLRQRAGRWSWSPLSARDYGGRTVDPLLLELQPGRHLLRFRTREPGAQLDGILVTNDLDFRPIGIWPGNLPERPARIWVEAESAELKAPLFIRSDSTATGGLYIEAEDEASRRSDPSDSAAGAAVLRFSVPEPGRYHFWARTRSRHDEEDSFWVRINGGSWTRWNGIPKGDAWRWTMIHDSDRQREVVQEELQPGENTLEFLNREGGARLDQILITNDPLFRPQGLVD